MWNEPIGVLRLAGYLEGATLIILLFIAVPLKYVAELPIAVSVMGPIHGLCFVFYLSTCVNTLSDGTWSRSETTRLLVASILPFGTFLNEGFLARKQKELSRIQ